MESNSKVDILGATYGTKIVTDIVQKMVNDWQTEIKANNDNFGVTIKSKMSISEFFSKYYNSSNDKKFLTIYYYIMAENEFVTAKCMEGETIKIYLK